ncbi:hypothetical protein LMH87_000988 [Akanthomyces muscarius]|uniref:O-acyltransferase n=1 Tax=Akanthomyces muscarius TaxID=2231603 RepID=A0A9W8QFM7_AKAMU|nr:hypothetical protein LMH87_000988 [Akanthomyces muscarius]KAJ4155757.1 hypothetical protein LMH87_000988 [Akanthomyces muscarius]
MLNYTTKKHPENPQTGNPDVHFSEGEGSHVEVTSPTQSSYPTLNRINDPSMPSEMQSVEDYDDNLRPKMLSALDSQVQSKHEQKEGLSGRRSTSASQSNSQGGNGIKHDSGLQLGGSASTSDHVRPERARKFKDLVFLRQVSTFDAQSEAAANSPFHGFYNLFWLSVALMICKISASNWRTYGNLLGPSDILKSMFHRDVVVLLLSDGIMCGLTAVTWFLQKLVLVNIVNWDRQGWIWQALFIAGAVKWTIHRDWSWTHTVFFVLHALVMLMKQHSYAFYNGHLSTMYHRRQMLLDKLKKLGFLDCTKDPSTDSLIFELSISPLSTSLSSGHHSDCSSPGGKSARFDADNILKTIDTAKTLGHEQLSLIKRAIKDEVDCLGDELKGTASNSSNVYPHNLTFLGHYEWIPLPTVVYELEYPRLEKINWGYLAEKVAAMIGIIFVMIQVSQYYIYPVVLVTIEMRESNMPLAARFKEFPWLLGDLIFPFMMEYLLTWYLIWETVLNILAELTCFADRHFYDAWWNSVSWDQFARDWNRPVHIFLLRHVYHSSISSLKVNKHTATIITFFLSACVHEFIMWCIFKKLRGYLLVLQMCQLPLVRLSQTSWLRDRKTLAKVAPAPRS